MFSELAAEEIVLLGFSRTLLAPLADVLPPASVLVVEEPDIAAKRDVPALARQHPAVSRVVLHEYQRAGAAAELLRSEPGVKNARAVLPGIEYAVQPAAELAALLGLPGAGAGAGAIFRDKARQRRTAQDAGIAIPRWSVVSTVAEAVDFVASAGTRCVLKPSALQASLGVCFVSGVEEVAGAFHHARAAAEPVLAPARGIEFELMVEQALDGPEYSVELLALRGERLFANVTAKRLLSGPYPVEVGHVVPGAPSPLAARLVAQTALLARASGFETGVLHAEWIVGSGGPALVECAARMPGDEIGTLISLAYDFPLTRAYLCALLGSRPEVPATPRYGAAIRFLTAPPGTVLEVVGAERAAAVPGVWAAKVSVAPGDVVRPATSSWNRAGYVIARAATAVEAERAAIGAAGLVEVRTRCP
jgi:biotin carboxylase